MDFITDLPPSRNNKTVYDTILVIIDRFSKMSLYIPAKKTWRAEDLADSFVKRVISRFGVPKGVVLDRGSVFISRMWVEICSHQAEETPEYRIPSTNRWADRATELDPEDLPKDLRQ